MTDLEALRISEGSYDRLDWLHAIKVRQDDNRWLTNWQLFSSQVKVMLLKTQGLVRFDYDEHWNPTYGTSEKMQVLAMKLCYPRTKFNGYKVISLCENPHCCNPAHLAIIGHHKYRPTNIEGYYWKDLRMLAKEKGSEALQPYLSTEKPSQVEMFCLKNIKEVPHEGYRTAIVAKVLSQLYEGDKNELYAYMRTKYKRGTNRIKVNGEWKSFSCYEGVQFKSEEVQDEYNRLLSEEVSKRNSI